MRLIDGDKLYETLHEIRMDEVAKYGRNDTKHCCSLSTALYEIYNAPTIEPVKNKLQRAVDGKTEEETYDFLSWLMFEYAKQYTDSRGAVIKWLKEDDAERKQG